MSTYPTRQAALAEAIRLGLKNYSILRKEDGQYDLAVSPEGIASHRESAILLAPASCREAVHSQFRRMT